MSKITDLKKKGYDIVGINPKIIKLRKGDSMIVLKYNEKKDTYEGLDFSDILDRMHLLVGK